MRSSVSGTAPRATNLAYDQPPSGIPRSVPAVPAAAPTISASRPNRARICPDVAATARGTVAFRVALPHGEHEGADDHEHRHQQRCAAHGAAHADQPGAGGSRVQELDGPTGVAGADLGGGAVQRPRHGPAHLLGVRPLGRQHTEGGDLPGVRGQPARLGGGEEQERLVTYGGGRGGDGGDAVAARGLGGLHGEPVTGPLPGPRGEVTVDDEVAGGLGALPVVSRYGVSAADSQA
ncbi:hypothetical protein [Streptomyces sp. NPDC006309]|uniref:hypothetical protein n=1 Tax=Streptomyces sp. NPDC006309 TaxID=3156749 RepID=UPI0033B1F308